MGTGLVLILLGQFLADCGVNSPYSGFNAAAKGIGFLACTGVWALANFIGRACSPKQKQQTRSCCARLSSRQQWWTIVKLAGPVAAVDFTDSVFAAAGIMWAKSGLFVIVFSSITVWVA